MEKFVYYNYLFDIYGNLLTEKNAKIFSLYYGENLSMQEIADLMQVSKSFVGTSIKNTENKLNDLESKLHINATNQELEKILNLQDIKEIKNIIEKLLNGE